MNVRRFIGMAFRKISAWWMFAIMGVICVSIVAIVTAPALIPLLGPVLALLIVFSSPAADWMDRKADHLLKP